MTRATITAYYAGFSSLLGPAPDLALCREISALVRIHNAKEEGPGGAYRTAADALAAARRVRARR